MASRNSGLRRQLDCATILILLGFVQLLEAQEESDEKEAPVGTTVQLPTFGVVIDPEGVLSMKFYRAPGRVLHTRRLAAAESVLPPDVIRWSPLRKISLVRLERALRRRLAGGLKPDDEMRHLAGLQRVRYVFCYPETGEIVLAGPAESWTWARDPAFSVSQQ